MTGTLYLLWIKKICFPSYYMVDRLG